MRRLAPAVAIAAGLLATAPASADDAKPSADHLKAAAEAFDAGVNAYKSHDFEAAAKHFEDADAAVPGARTLRQAIRAHVEGGHGAQAATLSAQALARYPNDDATTKLARETLQKYAPLLHKLQVTCASPCVVSVGARTVPGQPAKRWWVYLDPGSANIGATFPEAGEGAAAKPRPVEAKAGGEGELSLAPPHKETAAPPPPPPPPVAAPPPTKAELPPEEPKPEEPKPERKGISPVFFAIGAGATVALGATTIWSGIDTQTNPGPDAVRMQCQGKGTSCPAYQQGLAKQTRTNALIGATAGTAAVTVVLAIFTRWKSPKKEPAAEPTAIWVDRGAVLGASGVF